MSAKSPAQQGRRTPLSLTGAVTKSQSNKGSSNIANGGGNNGNSHQASNSSKQDNKSQQKNDQPVVSNFEVKDNPNKRQQTQSEKKPQSNEIKKSTEKSQNGVGSNKQQESSENKQQQQSKEKPKQSNGNDVNKIPEEKSEISDKSPKSVKDITKSKEDKKEEQNMSENKREEKKIKEFKEDKKEISIKSDAITDVQQEIKNDDKKSKDADKTKNVDKKSEEKIDNMETDNQKQQTSSNSATPKSSSKTNRTSTPIKFGEKTPQKSTPVKTTPVSKREVTTTIDDNDIEMEPLAIESSPTKPPQPEEAVNTKTAPSATSTPGKLLLSKRSLAAPKSDVKLALQGDISPERPRMLSQISGRKSIRQISDYTPSKFQSNLQYRESYRRINTELDVTNTSMNVTVGSEVANNLSFSFFGRGRKRDRTPLQHSQSAIGELQPDIETSPPKKARLDMYGIFSVVSSPLTLLRNRFSKTSLKSSTPFKLQHQLAAAEDEVEVQNVSGESVHEEIAASDKEHAGSNMTIDDNNATLGEEANEYKLHSPNETNEDEKELKEILNERETSSSAIGEQKAKNKGCVVM